MALAAATATMLARQSLAPASGRVGLEVALKEEKLCALSAPQIVKSSSMFRTMLYIKGHILPAC